MGLRVLLIGTGFYWLAFSLLSDWVRGLYEVREFHPTILDAGGFWDSDPAVRCVDLFDLFFPSGKDFVSSPVGLNDLHAFPQASLRIPMCEGLHFPIVRFDGRLVYAGGR